MVQNTTDNGSKALSQLSDVWAVRDRLADRILLPDLAEEFGVRYHELYQSVRRLGLDLEQHPTSPQFEVSEEAVPILRAELSACARFTSAP